MTLSHDIRYGIRVLLKSPGFVVAAVLSLALGIGANTTIFTMVNAVFLQPLPVEKPSELMYVYGTDSNNANSLFGGFMPVSYLNFADYRAQNHVFTDMGAYAFPVSVSLAGGEKPTPILPQLVTGNYFSLLGVHISLGRGFLPDEDQTPGARTVAVLSYKFFQRRFGANPSIIGDTVRLNGIPFTVIGVAPEGFEGTFGVLTPDMWLPVMSYPGLLPTFPGGALHQNRRLLFFNVFGRLKPGSTITQARSELQTIGSRLEQEYPNENKGRNADVRTLQESTIPPAFRNILLQGSTLLMVIVGLVLLIACANIANLMLARANARRREFTVRVALGSARSRLISQLLTESVLVALPGGILALIVAVGGRNLILSFLPPPLGSNNLNMSIDVSVLIFTFGISVVSGIVFGLVPALRASNPDLVSELKERAGSFAPAGRFNIRNLLVFFQVALSVIALASAGLFIRSLNNAQGVDLGFQKDNLVVAAYDVASNGYDEARGRQFHKMVVDHLKTVPGVASVALAAAAPLTPAFQRTVFPEGRETAGNNSGVLVFTNNIVPGYFDTIRMPLLRGRDFDDNDRQESVKVVIVNDTMAKKFWPNEDALGKRFKFFGDTDYRIIVGIARTSKYIFIGEDPQSMAYIPAEQLYTSAMTLHVRTTAPPDTVKSNIERELRSLDRDVAVNNVLTGPQLLSNSLFTQRMSATLLSIFGGIALVLAAVGIYGVMSYSVSQRAPEIGIRMALGAGRGEVQGMVLRQGMTIVGVGIAVGLVLAIAIGAAISRLLYGVRTADFMTFGTTALVLLLVAFIANYIPARRATAVDPVTVMRYE